MAKNKATQAPKEENPLISLLLNIVLPSLILYQFSEKHQLGPVRALVLALSIPLVYGIVDWRRRRNRGRVVFLSNCLNSPMNR